MWFGNQWFQGITGSRESLVPHIWECYRWVFRLCKPFFINWICFLAWKYLKPCAERPLEMVCYISWKLWNQWFPGTSDPLEPLVPKPHEFPLKNLGISDSLESVVPRIHLIPSADETTVTVVSSAEGIRWFQGTTDSRESLVPKFLKGNSCGLGTSGSLESLVPGNHWFHNFQLL